MNTVYGLLLAFVLVGLWMVLDHVRTPHARFETVRTLPQMQVASSAPVPPPPPTLSIQPVLTGKINLNTASLQELMELPRVGEKLAQRIMDGRPYRSLQDLDQVKGIGEKLLKTLEPLVGY